MPVIPYRMHKIHSMGWVCTRSTNCFSTRVSNPDVHWETSAYSATSGIPPFISEAELTDCPSRMACLCEALWSYAYVSTRNLSYVPAALPVHSFPNLRITHFGATESFLAQPWPRESLLQPRRIGVDMFTGCTFMLGITAVCLYAWQSCLKSLM